MADPVFTTRQSFENWQADFARSLVNRVRNKRVTRRDLREQAELIQRVSAAHAHLLTPESDR